ncbi:uncharacterized protein LOC100838971 [Brachypodium distachyon]|uniref:uncharacterized protein LOC100838971 n=1 Tax=Brachypodium distachyon TaxID=15368 RepID=UPI0001C75992|nr:uncharacterized protein LOC100838971 [Brachypodium distachyon]XP_010239482.1 uncharacterized protein LOC100838971 [Brachypodium distachyon]XP_024313226.1 uncharacterized protein LOC100838971 [Brachypodium distachyon]|eukprot:XP_003563241.1 uncharacterized protein LOC100838971 [Brachypodium distachyon]
MEPSDLNTHLPPRKRLLAGFRSAAAASSFDADPPPPPCPLLLSDDLAARLRAMMGPPASAPPSIDEIVQAARSAASAAADAAAAARAAAWDKAAVAAKSRAAARAAMEFLDSVYMSGAGGGASRNGIQLKAKSRKKHVQVKLLYKPNGRVREGKGALGDSSRPRRRNESDEEVARKLHRVMNSSPRISFTGPKRPRSLGAGKEGYRNEGGGDAACNGSSSHALTEVGGFANGRSVGKSSERNVQFSKIMGLHDGGDSSWNADNGVGIGNISAGRKVKIKRKQLLLNHTNGKETEEHKETEPSRDSIGYDEVKSNGAEKRPFFADARAPGDDPVPVKITSVWKFKKFKASHCSSDSKMLHNVCSSTSAAETSASVKAD